MAHLSISLLGPFQVILAGVPVTEFATDHARALLFYLVTESDRPHRREALAHLLWPNRPEKAARHNLRQALANIRDTIGDRDTSPAFLSITRQTVQFNQISDYWLDITAFTAHLAACKAHAHRRRAVCLPCVQRQAQAAALYQGDFLQGFTLPDSMPFEEWVLGHQEALHHQALDVLRHLARFHEQRGQPEIARHYVLKQLKLEPWREEAHQRLMRLLALDGQRSAALAQYAICRQALAEALNVEPTPQTTALFEQIKAGQGTYLTPTIPLHNLPAQLTSFVGREEELALITEYLGSANRRLVTIAGPGGAGKTRLALQAAVQQIGLFQDGVYFVPLAGVAAPQLLVPTIAKAINLTFHEAVDLTTQLLNHLRRQEMLLVLDNFEHLIAGADLVLDILRHAPQIIILVTSRERLNFQAERMLSLQGLPFPVDDKIAAATNYSAVNLFLNRADQAQPGFVLSPQNRASIFQICKLVEGIPLAIELAAAWVGTHSVGKIAAAIQANMDFLATTMRDMPPRHRSLRAVFIHSWRLLTSEEQIVLSQLTIFRGGFSVTAAAEVAEATSHLLISLKNKSLLNQVEPQRYDIHELVRLFALEYLGQIGSNGANQADTIRAKHSTFYLKLVAAQKSALYGQEPHQALSVIRIELDNVRQAWRWAITDLNLVDLEQSATNLARFYTLVGLTVEGKAAFEHATTYLKRLYQVGNLRSEGQRVLVQLLTELAHFLHFQRQLPQAIQVTQEAFDLAKMIEDTRSEVRTLTLWGSIEQHTGQVDSSLNRFEQALARAREEQFRDMEGDILILIGKSWRLQVNYPQSNHHYQQALTIQRELGNRSQEQKVLLCLGAANLEQRDLEAGEAYLRTALDLAKMTGDRANEARIVNALGYAGAYLGLYQQALSQHERSRHISHEIGDPHQESHALQNLCTVYLKLGNLEPARLHGEQAVAIAQAHHLTEAESNALTHLGYVLIALKQWGTAATTFRQALEGWSSVGNDAFAVEARAGLAEAHLGQERQAQAQHQVELILDYLTEHTLHGADEPFRIYLTCYRVLSANNDARAIFMLTQGHNLLQEVAAKVSDLSLRRTFLEEVMVNREIIQTVSRLASRRQIQLTTG